MNNDNYNYESPITRIQNQLLSEMRKNEEDQLMCEVRQTIGYQIDKAELIKALNYDRDQYNKGYQDGKADTQKVGQWIDDNCSECGQYVYHGDANNYCPNCGAKMESENKKT